MLFSKVIFPPFHALSKKFSRAGLYTWLDTVLAQERSTSGTILNIGSGGDIFERVKSLKNAKILQVDIDPERKPDIVADVCHLPMIESQSVEIVFMLEVLEHVKTPQEAINEIYRILKPNGKLYLSTPFIFPIHDEPYDFFRYTKYGLKHLLAQFPNIEIKERNDYTHAIMVLYARAIKAKGKKNIFAGLLLFIFALITYPILCAFSKLYTSTNATTGYVTTAKK